MNPTTPSQTLPPSAGHLDTLLFQHGSFRPVIEQLAHNQDLHPGDWDQLGALPFPYSTLDTYEDCVAAPNEGFQIDIAFLHEGLAVSQGSRLETLVGMEEKFLDELLEDRALLKAEDVTPEARAEAEERVRWLSILRNDLWRQAKLALEHRTLSAHIRACKILGEYARPEEVVDMLEAVSGALPSKAPERTSLRSRLAIELELDRQEEAAARDRLEAERKRESTATAQRRV